MQVDICEAKTRLSELVEQASQGETIVIAEAGKPLAKLVPLDEAPRRKIQFGTMRGEIDIADDFDGPLSDDALATFEGRTPE
jgi:prevent-host-death family protein